MHFLAFKNYTGYTIAGDQALFLVAGHSIAILQIEKKPVCFKIRAVKNFDAGQATGIAFILAFDGIEYLYPVFMSEAGSIHHSREHRQISAIYQGEDNFLNDENSPLIGKEFNVIFGGHRDGGILFLDQPVEQLEK